MVRVPGTKRDEFDELKPTYILAYDDEATLVGTWRLLSTAGAYMLKDVFPFLLDGTAAPRDAAIWEMSRFAVDRSPVSRVGPNGICRFTNELFCGLTEFCLSRGIREVVQVYDIRVARILPRWDAIPSGKAGSAE